MPASRSEEISGMHSPQQTRAVLFDLDGTLADTAPDMTDALNELLARHGRDTLEYERVRKHTSRGGIALIELGYDRPLDEHTIMRLRDEFLQIYARMLCIKTRLFPGIPALLDWLDQAGLPWGIVTNKPGRLTEPLIRELDLANRTGCTISGDSLPERKPSPEPLARAAQLLGVGRNECVYVGDDPRDIQAGQAASMKTAVAAYGYIQDSQDPRTWGADVILENALELKDWLFLQS